MTVCLPTRRLTQPRWLRDPLWTRARSVPSLDLRMENALLRDSVSGQRLVTFTRASPGTYIGSDGLIKSAATNLLLWSEEFDGAGWLRARSSTTLNVETAPDGLTTADKLVEDSTTGERYIERAVAIGAGTYTHSVYVKAAENNSMVFRPVHLGEASSTSSITFNLTTGPTATTNNLITGAAMQVLPNGWRRCSVTLTLTPAVTSAAFRVQMRDEESGSIDYTGDGTSGFYIWGAQLEQSSSVGEYIPTSATINSAPRITHDPTTGRRLGLLVEEARTNLLLRSEEFDDASWTKNATAVTANAATSPSGAATADALVEDTSTSVHNVLGSASCTSGTSYTFSVFVKTLGALRNLRMFIPGGVFGSSGNATFNLTAGTAGTVGPIASQFVEQLPGGWYRCGLTTSAATATSSGAFTFQLVNGAAGSYTGDGTSGIYLWGAQLEAGAFPTSYIPTTTAAVTRSADVASITGSAFSGWYRQDEGTVFAEAQIATNRSFSGTFRHLMQASPAGNSNSAVGLFVSSINQFSLQIRNNATNQAVINTGTNSGLTHRVAGVYKVDDFALSANGGSAAVDTLGTAPSTETVTQMAIGGVRDGNTFGVFNGTIRRLTYWPQRLANSTLQQITQ